jgi:hypothetical protein
MATAKLALTEVLIMRIGLFTAAAFAVLVPMAATAAEPEKTTLELKSGLISPGLPLAGSEKVVYGFRLVARTDKNGDWHGTLELNPNAPTYSEFGMETTSDTLPHVKLECSLKYTKTAKIRVRDRIAGPERDVDWLLFEILGPKITSPLFVATATEDNWKFARLLVHDKDGKVKFSINANDPRQSELVEPCHPGCFPAGTMILVPGGKTAVERIRAGDVVTTVEQDGKSSKGKVASIFVTKNRLFEVSTDAGDLITTETQPLALVAGGLKAAGELKAGDKIYRWADGERKATTVKSVTPTLREEKVFNLILGDPVLFIANGFLARSKPPVAAKIEGADERPKP